MSYLQTNTRLENLEVVERVGITLHHDWQYGGKKDGILHVTQFSTFNKSFLNLFMFSKLLALETLVKIKERKIGS